jgi:hypothetical protein
VTVALRGTEASVMLLDQTNFQKYRAGGRFRYTGGRYKRSPVLIAVPYLGHWHVVVDMGGRLGRVDASVSVSPA